MPRKIKVAPRRASKYLPNASTLGYARYKAFPGDVVTFREDMGNGDRHAIGRVIGVIDETDSDGECFTGKEMLLVLMLSSGQTHAFEHWISVDQVTQCMPVEHARHFMAWFLNADTTALMKYRNEDLETRKAAAYYPPTLTKKG